MARIFSFRTAFGAGVSCALLIAISSGAAATMGADAGIGFKVIVIENGCVPTFGIASVTSAVSSSQNLCLSNGYVGRETRIRPSPWYAFQSGLTPPRHKEPSARWMAVPSVQFGVPSVSEDT